MKCLHACRFCGRILYIDLSIMEDAVLRKSDFNSMREPPPPQTPPPQCPDAQEKGFEICKQKFSLFLVCIWFRRS